MGLLRVLLAIAVFSYHMGEQSYFKMMDGGAAVFCFFVISGFYMELVLTEKYTRDRLGSGFIKRFYLARFWRLYPTYLLVLVMTMLATFGFNLISAPSIFMEGVVWGSMSSVRLVVNYFANATMFFLNIPSTKDLLIAPGWTIGIELSFYILAPFILRAGKPALLIFILVGIGLQFLPFGQHAPFLFGIHYFIGGALMYRYRASFEAMIGKNNKVIMLVLYFIVVLLVFFVIPHEIYIGDPDKHTFNTIDRFLYPIALMFFIPLLHKATSKLSIDHWLGQISYPFYLVHSLVILCFTNWHENNKYFPLLAICILLSIFLVLIETRFVEPWRKKFSIK